MKDLKPITREETMLAKVAGQDVPELEPVTREEFFLAKAGGQDVPELEPVTRKEYFLADVIEAIESGGGGGSDLGTKTISANGVYKASDDSLDGYSKVTVNVPAPTGTKSISITENGTTTEDVTQYAGAEITVNVSGGGGISMDDIANGTAPSGAIVLSSAVTTVAAQAFYNKPITSVSGSAVTTVKTSAFQNCTSLTSATFPALTTIETNAFRGTNLTSASFPLATSVGGSAFEACQSLTSISLPAVTKPSNFAYNCQNLVSVDLSACTEVTGSTFQQCYALQFIDFPSLTKIGNNAFYNARKLSTLVLRRTGEVVTLDNIAAFTNTPFRGYNSQSGTVYVPQALISSYQTASNWSSLYSGGYCTFAAIEGSEYE